MYVEYYGLREPPFNVTPDPKFLYMTDGHRTALNHLLFGIQQRKGFVLLTGEVGTGKTTLCRRLLEMLGADCHTALILNPMLTGTQLLRAVVQEFGIGGGGRDRLTCMTVLNSFLLSAGEAGRDAVLIVDEAQDMSIQALEMTRLLSNLETDSRKLLQIVLAGQPELRAKLRTPGLRQLAQRISVRHHLLPISREETAGYLRHRLAVAGGGESVRFEDEAIDAVHEYSGGTPRLVNSICDKSLLAGYVEQTAVIGAHLVRMAVRDLREAA